MLNEFKAFVLRGNVVDLAVAVVIGTAFADVVESAVDNLFSPLIGIPGSANFDQLDFTVAGSTFGYGRFITQVISFLSIAAVVFFFVVRPLNRLMARRKTEPDVESTTRDCPECLSSIPRAASRCAFCTAVSAPAA
ncbi:MAG: large conductance mechanosensitive channel protein MscL [Acidimicrobiia bacterium]